MAEITKIDVNGVVYDIGSSSTNNYVTDVDLTRTVITNTEIEIAANAEFKDGSTGDNKTVVLPLVNIDDNLAGLMSPTDLQAIYTRLATLEDNVISLAGRVTILEEEESGETPTPTPTESITITVYAPSWQAANTLNWTLTVVNNTSESLTCSDVSIFSSDSAHTYGTTVTEDTPSTIPSADPSTNQYRIGEVTVSANGTYNTSGTISGSSSTKYVYACATVGSTTYYTQNVVVPTYPYND